MSALFDDIRRRRHEIEQTEQLRQRGLYQQFYRLDRSRQARADARRQLDEDTLRTLHAFCESAYPHMRIQTYEQGWSVGQWKSNPDKSLAWESIVVITLRYDNQDRPVSYDCRGHNRHLVASLTPEALLQMLRRIYRSKQENAAPQSKGKPKGSPSRTG